MPGLKSYLKGMGIIYTVRKYQMSDAIVEVAGLGKCRRIPMGIVDRKEGLEPYVKYSGFSSLEDWWNKIKFFIPGNDTMYLYRVEVIK